MFKAVAGAHPCNRTGNLSWSIMYPNKIFFGMTLYDILIALGIISCFFLVIALADRAKLKNRFQRFFLLCGLAAILCGFGSAILFQAVYNIAEIGSFELARNTGATFYGGLIGGVAVFLILYFAVGKYYFKGELVGYHKKNFFLFSACGVPGITLAHGFGRLGCLFAGCCHGARSDAWCAMPMYSQDYGYGRYIPIQLFEALFLFALTAILIVLALKGKTFGLALYAGSYAIWRFVIEFFRDDQRGGIGNLPISPSQLIALFMLGIAVAVFLLEQKFSGEKRTENTENT